jgi:hypothetical protein
MVELRPVVIRVRRPTGTWDMIPASLKAVSRLIYVRVPARNRAAPFVSALVVYVGIQVDAATYPFKKS